VKTKSEATTIYNEFMILMAEFIENTDSDGFKLPELGIFYVKQRAARKGKNPRTGEVINIPAQHAISFKPSKALKDNALKNKV
jgi:DNA-binding protein HU-beta